MHQLKQEKSITEIPLVLVIATILLIIFIVGFVQFWLPNASLVDYFLPFVVYVPPVNLVLGLIAIIQMVRKNKITKYAFWLAIFNIGVFAVLYLLPILFDGFLD